MLKLAKRKTIGWSSNKSMFFIALAVDYDGTIARDGRVDAATIAALEKVKKSGRKLILVTGRDLDDLQRVFPAIEIFDLVVAENGALLFDPAKKEEVLLAQAPADKFVEYLRRREVAPLSIGRSIVATWEPNETIVLEAIRDLGLELHIIFNKGAVMVLPVEINKASGLKQALKRLGLSPYNVVGIGDAENDQAFLNACGCSVAVANALPSVKEKADFLVGDHGAGVVELAEMLTETDLAGRRTSVARVQPFIGETDDGLSRQLNPFETVLVTGSSGAGKSTVVTALLEQMVANNIQFCVVDPEGDYAEFPAVTVGDAKHEPPASEVMDLLAKPDTSVVVNLLAVDPAERPRYLAELMPELSKLRINTGRPHWIVLDEAHHCLPAKWDPAPVSLPQELPASIAVTVHPEEVSPDFLKLVSTVLGVGDKAAEAIKKFCAAAGHSCAGFSGPLDARRGACLDTRGRVAKDRSPTAPSATAASCAEICRRGARRRQELLLSRSQRNTEPPRPKSGYLSPNGRGGRRPDMDASFARGGIFAVVWRSHQGRRTGSRNERRRAERQIIGGGNARPHQGSRRTQIYGPGKNDLATSTGERAEPTRRLLAHPPAA